MRRRTGERFFGPYDYIADAIDLVSCKVDLICQAMERGIPILSALGTGNKLDPSLIEVTDLSKTKGAPWPGSCAGSWAAGESVI